MPTRKPDTCGVGQPAAASRCNKLGPQRRKCSCKEVGMSNRLGVGATGGLLDPCGGATSLAGACARLRIGHMAMAMAARNQPDFEPKRHGHLNTEQKRQSKSSSISSTTTTTKSGSIGSDESDSSSSNSNSSSSNSSSSAAAAAEAARTGQINRGRIGCFTSTTPPVQSMFLWLPARAWQAPMPTNAPKNPQHPQPTEPDPSSSHHGWEARLEPQTKSLFANQNGKGTAKALQAQGTELCPNTKTKETT